MNNKLFKDLNVSNQPTRSGFDLSFNTKFTASPGELLPITCKTVMIGDHLEGKVNHFTRTAPVQTAAMVKIREYFDWFFVPYRLLYKSAPQILAQNTQNPVVATSPSSNQTIGTQLPQMWTSVLYNPDLSFLKNMNSNNEFGYPRIPLAFKLMNHLGFPFHKQSDIESYMTSMNDGVSPYEGRPAYRPYVSLFPHAAYQKIYYDYFRNSAWEDNQPYNYNFDYLSSEAVVDFRNINDESYWNNPTIFDLRYANYPKDIFYGLLPESQWGDEAVVEVDQTSDGDSFLPLQLKNDADKKIYGTDGYIDFAPQGSGDNPVQSVTTDNYLGVALKGLAGQFSILELRKQKMVQKYREIMGSGSKDYQNIVKKVFGVDVPDTLADHCIYLGGSSSDIDISEVVNTNLANAEADIKGKGIGSNKGDGFSYDAVEPGVLMCIYHAVPIIDYALTAWDFDLLKTEVDDYANPVFDKLGFQELPYYYLNTRFDNSFATYRGNVGYTSRYFDYKTSIDNVLGGFREQELQSWVAPVNLEYLKDYLVPEQVGDNIFNVQINSTFFKVSPNILDPIFGLKYNGSVARDYLRISASVELHAVRNLDYLGMPF